MHIATRVAALVTTVLISIAGAHAENLSKEAMFARLNALASTGDADIQYNLGMFLNNGIGTARDPQAAFRHFSEAAEAGNALAAYKMGCYSAGEFPGVVQLDEEAAFKFKLRAAQAGYALAQFDVGMYFGRKQDAENAALWWERASRQGNVAATAYLANYLSGKASPNKAKGYALMLQLKEQMPSTSQEFLARMAELEAQLSASEKSEAGTIRASWLTGKSPLTVKAEAGITAVPALLTSLESR